MGVPIDGYENWTKFVRVHKEMGIDFDKVIQNKFYEVLTEEAIDDLIKDLVF
jgi:hypothetical protein